MVTVVTATPSIAGNGSSKLYLITLAASGDYTLIAADTGTVLMITAIRTTGRITLKHINATITNPSAWHESNRDGGVPVTTPDNMSVTNIKVHSDQYLKITSADTASITVEIESQVVA